MLRGTPIPLYSESRVASQLAVGPQCLWLLLVAEDHVQDSEHPAGHAALLHAASEDKDRPPASGVWHGKDRGLFRSAGTLKHTLGLPVAEGHVVNDGGLEHWRKHS